MRNFEKDLYFFFCVYFALLLVWAIALFINNQKTTDWNYMFNAAYAVIFLSGGVIAFAGAKRAGLHNSVGKELFWLGTAVTCFSIGLFIWAYYNLVLHIDTPFPSLADLFFVMYTPFLGYGVIHLLSVFGIRNTKRLYFETFGIFLIAAYLIFTIGNPPDLSLELPVLTRVLNIYYLLGDSLHITLAIMLLRLTDGKIHKSFFYFFAGMFAMATADFIFSYRTASNVYWNGDITDIFFAFAGLMYTLGIIKIVSTQAIIYKYLPKTKV